MTPLIHRLTGSHLSRIMVASTVCLTLSCLSRSASADDQAPVVPGGNLVAAAPSQAPATTKPAAIAGNAAPAAPYIDSTSTITVPPPASAPTWTPNKKQMSNLGPASDLIGYSFQAPLGWEQRSRGGPGKIGALFLSAPMFAGMRASYQIMVFGIPGWQADKRTVADFLDFRIKNIERMNNDWQVTPMDFGMINGLEFGRRHFSGTDMQSGLKLQGFMYICRTGHDLIEIIGEDLADDAPKTLPMVEAAAQTFRKLPDFGEPTHL